MDSVSLFDAVSKKNRELPIYWNCVLNRTLTSLMANSDADRFYSSVEERPSVVSTGQSPTHSSARISSIGTSLTLSSRTHKILEELEKLTTPVKESSKGVCKWQPERWADTPNPFNMYNSSRSVGLGRLRGPPLSSLSSPSRAQLLSRTFSSIGAKPYWRRLLKASSRKNEGGVEVDEVNKSKTLSNITTKSLPLKKSGNIKTFSARVPELELDYDLSAKRTVSFVSNDAPNPGFLNGMAKYEALSSNKFKFAKPLPKFCPSMSSHVHAFTSPDLVSSANVTVSCLPTRIGSASMSNSVAVAPTLAITTIANDQPTDVTRNDQEKIENGLKKEWWFCGECFVKNDTKVAQCCCCSAARVPNEEPKSKMPTEWKCRKCSVSNAGDCAVCVWCHASRDGAARDGAPHPTWTCPTCFIANDDAIDVCLCCSTNRRGKTASKADKLFSNSLFSTTSNKPITTGSADSQSTSVWSCTTCFISNRAHQQNCQACQSAKPTNFNKSSTMSFGFGVPSMDMKKRELSTKLIPAVTSEGLIERPFGTLSNISEPVVQVTTSASPDLSAALPIATVPTLHFEPVSTATTTSITSPKVVTTESAPISISNPDLTSTTFQFGSMTKPTFQFGSGISGQVVSTTTNASKMSSVPIKELITTTVSTPISTPSQFSSNSNSWIPASTGSKETQSKSTFNFSSSLAAPTSTKSSIPQFPLSNAFGGSSAASAPSVSLSEAAFAFPSSTTVGGFSFGGPATTTVGLTAVVPGSFNFITSAASSSSAQASDSNIFQFGGASPTTNLFTAPSTGTGTTTGSSQSRKMLTARRKGFSRR